MVEREPRPPERMVDVHLPPRLLVRERLQWVCIVLRLRRHRVPLVAYERLLLPESGRHPNPSEVLLRRFVLPQLVLGVLQDVLLLVLPVTREESVVRGGFRLSVNLELPLFLPSALPHLRPLCPESSRERPPVQWHPLPLLGGPVPLLVGRRVLPVPLLLVTHTGELQVVAPLVQDVLRRDEGLQEHPVQRQRKEPVFRPGGDRPCHGPEPSQETVRTVVHKEPLLRERPVVPRPLGVPPRRG